MDDDRYDLGDVDAHDPHELESISSQGIANEIAAAVARMSPEQRVCIRQAVTWQLLHKCEWTPGDLEFLAEAGIKP